MFKHIAIGLDGSLHAAAAEEFGLALAARVGASLRGVHVIDVTFLEGAFITDISGAMGFEPFLNLQAQTRSTLEELARLLQARFEEKCSAAGLAGEFQVERTSVVNGLLATARLADLFVVGQRGVNARLHENMLGPVPGALLRRSPIPVLVVPEGGALPRRPIVAYDGSPKAVRALHLAAELCQVLALPLTVLTVDEDPERGRSRLAEATHYLSPFDLRVETIHERGEAVEEIVLAHLEPGDLDLLCLGAHGHNRIVELVLGSTSEFLARRSPVAVLCATRP
ncbi:MAG: universal stress protein [Acidobacteriota bacterium]